MVYIRIADLNIAIDNKYKYLVGLCRDFAVDPFDNADISVRVSEEEIDGEIAISQYAVSRGYAESICAYRQICKLMPVKFSGFLLHGALIEYEGRGYVFSATSGTGKSTHIAIWQKVFGDGVRIVNGDKPIVRYLNGKFIAYGTPWCGKEGFSSNGSTELSALCFIERDASNSICEMLGADAVSRVFAQILMPEDIESFDAVSQLLDKLLTTVPCYLLKCNMEDEAATVAYNGMNKR